MLFEVCINRPLSRGRFFGSPNLTFRNLLLTGGSRKPEFGKIQATEGVVLFVSAWFVYIVKSASVGYLTHRIVTSILQFRALDLMASILMRLHTMLGQKHRVDLMRALPGFARLNTDRISGPPE